MSQPAAGYDMLTMQEGRFEVWAVETEGDDPGRANGFENLAAVHQANRKGGRRRVSRTKRHRGPAGTPVKEEASSVTRPIAFGAGTDLRQDRHIKSPHGQEITVPGRFGISNAHQT